MGPIDGDNPGVVNPYCRGQAGSDHLFCRLHQAASKLSGIAERAFRVGSHPDCGLANSREIPARRQLNPQQPIFGSGDFRVKQFVRGNRRAAQDHFGRVQNQPLQAKIN
jgi:hypothetical protein